jgi:hypothetical protein
VDAVCVPIIVDWKVMELKSWHVWLMAKEYWDLKSVMEMLIVVWM